MTEKTFRKEWTDQEKIYLSLGHKLGASLKTLSIVFNRTETSLNKALERLGIRQYGAHKPGKKAKREKLFMVTPQNLRDCIAAYEKQKSNQSLYEENNHEKQDVNFKADIFPNPLIKFPKRRSQVPLPFWSDLDFVISLLKNNGHRVHRHVGPLTIVGGVKIEFWLDSIPMSAAQLLVRANRLRLEQGLEAFYVESITEH